MIVRVRGQHVQVLLSDGGGRGDWPIARDVARLPRRESTSPTTTRTRGGEPVGDLDMLADLGLSEFELGTIVDDLDLGSDQMLGEIAEQDQHQPGVLAGDRGRVPRTAGATSRVVTPLGRGHAPRAGRGRGGVVGAGDVPVGAVVLDPAGAVVAVAGNERERPATRPRTPRSWRCARRPRRRGQLAAGRPHPGRDAGAVHDVRRRTGAGPGRDGWCSARTTRRPARWPRSSTWCATRG